MMVLGRIGADVWSTSPRLRGEVGFYAKRKIRVRGTLRESRCRSSPSPQPSPRKSGARESLTPPKNHLLTITGARLRLSRLRDGLGACFARVSIADHRCGGCARSVGLHALGRAG